MSSGSHPQSQHLCTECRASFFTKEGLEKHFQRQHGIYCESCPIDTAVQKITDIFRQKKLQIKICIAFLILKKSNIK